MCPYCFHGRAQTNNENIWDGVENAESHIYTEDEWITRLAPAPTDSHPCPPPGHSWMSFRLWQAADEWETDVTPKDHKHTYFKRPDGSWGFHSHPPLLGVGLLDIELHLREYKAQETHHNECMLLQSFIYYEWDRQSPIHIKMASRFLCMVMHDWIHRWVYNFGRNSANKSPLYLQPCTHSTDTSKNPREESGGAISRTRNGPYAPKTGPSGG